MKSFIVLAVLVAAAAALPVDSIERNAETLRSEFDNLGIDKYNYRIETSNGINIVATAELESVPLPEGGYTEGLIVKGEYSYPGPDGKLYKVTYVADKDGYRAFGEHIPA